MAEQRSFGKCRLTIAPALAHHRDLTLFYGLLAALQARIGRQTLRACHGRLNWPRRGVYFFFEAGEFRPDGETPRVVRVGTHAVSTGSKTTLWNRLSTHRGTRSGGGNHRGSIFRLWVGTALLKADKNLKARLLAPMSELQQHRQSLIRTLHAISANGCTDIDAGLRMARDCFDWNQPDVVRRIVLLTDGHGGNPLGTAEDLKERGVVVDVIGIGADPSRVNEELLRSVASVVAGESRYRFIRDSRTLCGVYDALARKTHIR